MSSLETATLNRDSYVSLLGQMIGVAERLQNHPPAHVPQEDLVGDFVLQRLSPFLKENGGVLELERINYVQGRNNIIIKYPGKHADKTVSFVGSHMDVVTANAEEWDRNPFKLEVEGDKLYGRGTTDCIGHVALLTELFAFLGESKPELDVTIYCVLIANEENSQIEGIGIDEMVKHGLLEPIKNGPVYWIDTADSQPCIGTGGCAVWTLKATGRKGHSGLPQKAINPIVLCYEAMTEVLRRFHEDFPAHENETKWNFLSPSTMKPTSWSYPTGSANQIPQEAQVGGDIRLTPFYDFKEVIAKVNSYVDDINKDVTKLDTRGPVMTNTLADGSKGVVSIEWEGEVLNGIACNIDGAGQKAIKVVAEEILGEYKPYSITGSLPLVRELQEEGFDIQMVGFGHSDVYHGLNEYASFSHMEKGFKAFAKIIQILNKSL